MIAVDAGNTNIKVLTISASGEVMAQQVWPAEEVQACIDWLSHQGDSVWIAETSGRTWPVGRQVHFGMPWSFTLDYAPTVGTDRLAAIEGAMHRFPSRSMLVISCGTCLTYSYLNSMGQFQGGAIAPGLRARLHSMASHTGSLPELELPSPEQWSAYSGADPRTLTTESSMLRGAVRGMVDEVIAEVARFQQMDPKIITLVHGGDAYALEGRLKNGIFADENWVALGLWSIAARV